MGIVGNRIRDLRIINHLTQEDVAKCLGIGKQAIYKYETGAVTNIPLENISKMADLFHTSPEYLAGWTDIDPSIISHDLNKLELSADEKALITLYRGAEQSAKEIALETLANHQKKGSEETAI